MSRRPSDAVDSIGPMMEMHIGARFLATQRREYSMTRLILVSLFIVVGTLATLTSMAQSNRQSPGGTVTLLSVTETRRIDYRPKDDDAMTFTSDAPGLMLDFKVQLPDGLQLAEVAQPSTVQAQDSTGTDLSDVEPDFAGDKTYLSVVHSWDAPPTEIQFMLALPTRNATSFSLDALAQAQVFASHETTEIELTEVWQKLDRNVLGIDGATIRFRNSSHGPTVQIRPGTVKDRIETLELFNSQGEPLDSSWTQWTDADVEYTFNGQGDAHMKAKITARMGFQVMPITITLKDQKLP
jgi:hypothetical protein